MISRRQIRVKVMQVLYTLSASGDTDTDSLLKRSGPALAQQLDQTLYQFTGALLLVIRLAQHAETDALRRKSKHLPTTEDLTVPTKIAGNTTLWSILENEDFMRRVRESGLEKHVTDEFLKVGYKALQNAPEYQAYNSTETRDPKEEKAMFQFIWDKLISGTEWGREFLNEQFSGWEDDAEIMKMIMENFFRKPSKAQYRQLLSEEKQKYAQELLRNVINRREYVDELIQPRLQNWDPERVAQIDFILLRMGVCELLYFPTIPTKVTINEYIDIGKTYSTAQSGQFINGVLDNILKGLTKEGLIRKLDRTKNV